MKNFKQKYTKPMIAIAAALSGFMLTSIVYSEPAVAPTDLVNNVEIAATPDASTPVLSDASKDMSKPAKRLWNLQDADILSVINEVSQETGKNFVVDPRVSGKITLISSKPLRQGEVYQVFLSVLGLLGYSAIPSGNVVKIVPNMESGEQATTVATNTAPGKGDEVVVRVFPLENVSATQLIPVIRPLLPQWSNVSAYTPGNVLILLGRASNLDRVFNIIQDVDRAANSGIQIIPLHHASAAQVATVLNNLQTAARASGEAPSVSIAVDERSNSILLGGPKGTRMRMSVLISQLDSPSTSPAGNTEVIYLRYLQAKTLAPLLGKIAANILGKSSGSQFDISSSTTTSNSLNSSSTTSNKSGDTAPNTTNIQAEPNTNAVIITAPPALMQALKSVIEKLDIRPAEVMVEAIIAEVDESNITSLGIQWGSITPEGMVQQSGGNATSFPSLGAGVVGIMPHVQIQAILTALRNQNGVDILSTPTIMVLDNQKAKIEIGQDVPFQTGSYATTTQTTTVTPFTTNNYKPVTLKLEVTPQINLGTSVRLKLSLKNDSLQNPQNPTLTPVINTSTIDNSVIIDSNDILVLGGLMSRSNNDNINKVPILGDLPIVGPLFQQKTTNQQKKNLLVFIKPVIICNQDVGMTITHMKYNGVRDLQANYTEDLDTIGDKAVKTRLPPWKNTKDLPTPFEKPQT